MKKWTRYLMVVLVLCITVLFAFHSNVQAASKKIAKPKITSVKNVSDKVVQVNWKKVKYAKKYQVYVSVNGGKYKKIKTTKSRSYKHANLTDGTTYSYKIRAINGKRKSAFSKVRKITLPVDNTNQMLTQEQQLEAERGLNAELQQRYEKLYREFDEQKEKLRELEERDEANRITELVLDKTNITITMGGFDQIITATVIPEQEHIIPDNRVNIAWFSLDENVAMVDSADINGRKAIICPRDLGTTKIIAVAGSQMAVCDVTVIGESPEHT